MRSKENVAKEYGMRLEALEQKYVHDKDQLQKRFDQEKKIIDERYSRILKAFEHKKPN
jgi:hypothetical protein